MLGTEPEQFTVVGNGRLSTMTQLKLLGATTGAQIISLGFGKRYLQPFFIFNSQQRHNFCRRAALAQQIGHYFHRLVYMIEERFVPSA